jgi:hypothetical protein
MAVALTFLSGRPKRSFPGGTSMFPSAHRCDAAAGRRSLAARSAERMMVVIRPRRGKQPDLGVMAKKLDYSTGFG